jgi:cell division transport system permease protein
MAKPNSKPSPIFPKGAAPLRALTVTMAVMCYLACLAIGALVLVNRAAEAWSQGIAREVTVQIREISGENMDKSLTIALGILKTTPGVLDAKALDRQEGIKLLEPWLGKIAMDELPVPRLIRVSVDEQAPPDYPALEMSLQAEVKGISLDTHRRWQAELARMGRALSLLASLVLALITLASIMLVVFAARSVLEANRSVVEVLELIGAEHKFISRQNDKQFLSTGLLAGFAGLISGLLTFLGLSLAGGATGDSVAAAGRSLIFAPADLELRLWGALLLVPLAATLIALWTSRFALMRMLRQHR